MSPFVEGGVQEGIERRRSFAERRPSVGFVVVSPER
jgi:hypothetical protein